jgi:hypothetical protein
MANINRIGFFYPFKTDLKKLFLNKTRTPKTCVSCLETIPPRSYCLGKSGNWMSSFICLKCSEKFLNNFIETTEQFKQIGEKTLKDIKKHREKYERTNSVARI